MPSVSQRRYGVSTDEDVLRLARDLRRACDRQGDVGELAEQTEEVLVEILEAILEDLRE